MYDNRSCMDHCGFEFTRKVIYTPLKFFRYCYLSLDLIVALNMLKCSTIEDYLKDKNYNLHGAIVVCVLGNHPNPIWP
ncbi:hypothetical protein QVD17_01606 [Tagetes erecta]|uniref:Uncharacterized protein n=1 Tax=Tagetes erecta TaxID=13708 RepID=A0AAD8LAZ4_TARER|nr:hypothetical protein QVD17_01606 [Tagetes erecta]